MLTHTDLRKSVRIILEGEPYEILEAQPLKKAQRRVVIQTKIRNSITGNVFSRNFHQGDIFKEAEISKFKAKFLHSHRERFFFCQEESTPPSEVKPSEVGFAEFHSSLALRFARADETKFQRSQRFDLTANQIGPGYKFLKPGQTVEGIIFDKKVINVSLPIKIQLKVIEAPPGVKGERAQAGTKTVTLESKAKINVPLFIEEGDVVEVNTETGEYVRRIK